MGDTTHRTSAESVSEQKKINDLQHMVSCLLSNGLTVIFVETILVCLIQMAES